MYFQFLHENGQHSVLTNRRLLLRRSVLNDSDILRIAEVDLSEILVLSEVDLILLETHVNVIVDTNTQFDEADRHIDCVYL